MKLVAGAILLAAAEQAYAHAQLVLYPHHESAAAVLIPGSLVLLLLGLLILIWGLLAEVQAASRP